MICENCGHIHRPNTLNPDYIIETIADAYDVKVVNILSAKRDRKFALPRQVISYFIQKYTFQSLKTIGRKLNRHHSSIIHHINEVKKFINTEPQYANQIKYLEELLNGKEVERVVFKTPAKVNKTIEPKKIKKVKIVSRPPAIYSNKSVYGIADELHKKTA